MKKLYKIALASLLSLLLYSCSENSPEIDQQELNLDFSEFKMDLKNLDITKSQIVFNYNNKAKQNSQKFLNALFDEIDEIIESDKKITNVLFKLNFSDGKAIMKDIFILNAKDKIILNNPSSESTVRNPEIVDWEAVLNGARCGNGWDDNGTCSSRNCVADTTAQILGDPDGGINGSGDCVEIQYNRGLLSVRICSRSC